MAKAECNTITCLSGPGGWTNGCADGGFKCIYAKDGKFYNAETIPCAECQALFGDTPQLMMNLGICNSFCQQPNTQAGNSLGVSAIGASKSAFVIGVLLLIIALIIFLAWKLAR